MLASVSGAESVLELGTFTGYSALCFAEGIAKGRSKNRGVKKVADEVVGEVVDEVVVEDELEVGDISDEVMNSEMIANVEHINAKNGSNTESVDISSTKLRRRQDIKDEKRMKINEKIKEMQKNIISSKIIKIEINEKPTFISRRSVENSLKRQKISAKIEEKKNEIEKARQSRLEIELNAGKELVSNDKNQQNSMDTRDQKGDEKRESRGSVVTCEVDPSAAEIALEHFQESEYKDEV
jgi:O-methyltransferase